METDIGLLCYPRDASTFVGTACAADRGVDGVLCNPVTETRAFVESFPKPEP